MFFTLIDEIRDGMLCKVKSFVNSGENGEISYVFDFCLFRKSETVLYHRIGAIRNGSVAVLPSRFPKNYEGRYYGAEGKVYYRNTFGKDNPRFCRYPAESVLTEQVEMGKREQKV